MAAGSRSSCPSDPAASALLIAGPTGTGKSALALALAKAHQAAIINADSMQVYRELAILTARPGPAALQQAPHRLYGHRPARVPYSVADWRAELDREAEAAAAAGRPVIIVGGTGLYFRALTHGLAAVPDIPATIRDPIRARAHSDPQGNYAALQGADPAMASRLAPGDRQRVARALEVVAATGRSLIDYQGAGNATPAPPLRVIAKLVVLPARSELYHRIETRFDAMMSAGALEEAEAVAALGLDPALPAMKALGLAPLIRHLAGDISRAEAVGLAKRDSRRYAKRQTTWFRHQCRDWSICPDHDSAMAAFSSFVS